MSNDYRVDITTSDYYVDVGFTVNYKKINKKLETNKIVAGFNDLARKTYRHARYRLNWHDKQVTDLHKAFFDTKNSATILPDNLGEAHTINATATSISAADIAALHKKIMDYNNSLKMDDVSLVKVSEMLTYSDIKTQIIAGEEPAQLGELKQEFNLNDMGDQTLAKNAVIVLVQNLEKTDKLFNRLRDMVQKMRKNKSGWDAAKEKYK